MHGSTGQLIKMSLCRIEDQINDACHNKSILYKRMFSIRYAVPSDPIDTLSILYHFYPTEQCKLEEFKLFYL